MTGPARRLVQRSEVWLTGEKHSQYGVAVTRMILGFVVWSQLAVNWSDRHYTWGDGARWASPIREAKSWPWFFGLFDQASGSVFDLLYAATIVVGLMLMLGLFTRVASVLTLLLWMSLYVTNPFVGSGGDAVLRMVLLYLCFTDCGRIWSVDARPADRRGAARALLPGWMSASLHNVALVLIIHQVVMVYVGSALWKLQGPLWKDGTAVYYPMQTEAYSPWADALHPVTSFGPLITAATWSALVVQLFFPVLLLHRPTRLFALVVITGMHLGIGFGMGILYFSLVMIAVDMILVSDRSWQDGLITVRRVTRGRGVSRASSWEESEKNSEVVRPQT